MAPSDPKRISKFRLGYVSLMAGVIGGLAAGIAYLIYHFIGLLYNVFFYHRVAFTFIEPPTSGLPLWIILVPALGGLVAGLMAKYGSERIIGHGIPEAMEAVWSNRSKVKPRILFLKPISAAIAIGTGAPFGVEGPIIQSGGAMGSVLGQWFSTTVAERKVLLGCGAAAGMAATFNTPLAGILVAIELLVFEFRARSFIPISIASIIAAAARRPLIGTGRMFEMGAVPVDLFPHLPFLIGLGVVIGGAAILFKTGYFWIEEWIRRIPVDDALLPALGGIALGVMGYFVPRTFGVGYRVAGEILNNELAVGLVLVVMLFKSVGVSVALGSKTSGGFLAPMFVAGAAIGSAFAHGVNAFVPGAAVPVGLFALAGLGTLFGVVSNATFGFTLFALEVTGQFEAILPVFLVAAVADGITTLYMGPDIMTTELSARGIEVHQDYEIDVLKRFAVGDVMDEHALTLDPEVPVAKLATLISRTKVAEASHVTERDVDALIEASSVEASSVEASSVEASAEAPASGARAGARTIHEAFPLVDADERLVGIVTYGDLLRAIARGEKNATAREAGTTDLIVATPEEQLFEAVVRMAEHEIEQLPVVARGQEGTLVGFLDSGDYIKSALRQLDDEQRRESGWMRGYLDRFSKRRRPAAAPPTER